MNHLHRQIIVVALLTLLVGLSSLPADGTLGTHPVSLSSNSPQPVLASSLPNISAPFVDQHYGYADGIIDPQEYALNFTDPATGVTVYMEHNSSVLFVGLEAPTSGWVGIGWKAPNGTYTTDGLNNTDLVYGFAPGTPHKAFPRVTGNEVVAVEYRLYDRNGTLLEEGMAPDGTGDTPLNEEKLLTAYKEAIIGMRVGEVRHFIIPAEEAYNSPGHELYGKDLEYVVTLRKIGSSEENPADYSRIVYRDDHGVSTFNHLPDDDSTRILAANASDNGATTSIEYFIRMNSTDTNDVPLVSANNIYYPFVLLIGADEDIDGFPVRHTDWSSPMMIRLVPNTPPRINPVSPKDGDSLDWIMDLRINITDNSWVRRAFFRFDNESWNPLEYDFKSDLWTGVLDVSDYESGTAHTLWFNATDPSNTTSVMFINVTVEIPYTPLLGITLRVARTVSTLLYHSVKSEDVFTIVNDDAVPISAFDVFLPKPYTSNFMSIEAESESEAALQVVRVGDYNGMYRWRVYFLDQVEPGETYEFTVRMFFHSTHTLINSDDNLYEMRFLKYPVVPYVISRLSFTIGFRSGDSLHSGTNPEGVYTNIAPMTVESFEIVIKSFTPLLAATRTTEITVDPWGWLHYKETIHVDNIGPARENDLTFTFPAYASNIRIYDQVGILAASMPHDYDWNATFDQRINLKADRFGEKGFWPNYKYTFNVEYDIYLPEYQEVVPRGLRIDFPMATLDELLVRSHTVDIIIPTSVNVVYISGEYRLLSGPFNAIFRYSYFNTTVHNPPRSYLIYQVTIGVFARPLIFSAIVGLVAAAYVVARKARLEVTTEAAARGGPVAAQVGAPPELLSSFAKTYSRKTALNLDLEKLESARRKGKVSKREFMVRERDIKSQLQQIESELSSLKQELMQYGSRYRDMIAQLELQEERMEGAKAGLRQLLLRKKKQRISRAAFEKTRQEYLKTIKQAVTATDRILLSMQEEAGEI